MNIHSFTGGFYFAPSTNHLKNLFKVNAKTVTHYHPATVTIPFDQHIGAPNELIVKIGEEVAEGQIIAKNSAEISGHVHASISGKVLAVVEVPSFGQETQSAVLIKRQSAISQPVLIKPELSIEETVRKAGIVGMGGATFPTHVKLDPDPAINVQTVILNGAECEPFLVSDDYLMRFEAEKILRGGVIARESLGANQIIVGIEKDKPEAIKAMEQAAADISDCSVAVLPVKYPQGGEGQLLETLINTEAPKDGRSVETGAFTINVATAFAIAEAVDEKKSLTKRYITVTGDVVNPQVIEFPLGTKIADLIEFCGGFVGTPAKIIHGGPMMGKAVADLDLPLTKGSNGLIVLNTEHDQEYQESPCIRCNRCVAVCPIRLEPQNIDLAYRSDDLFRCNQLQAEACINCGCCTYVCPARRHLAENITKAAGKIKALKKELAEDD